MFSGRRLAVAGLRAWQPWDRWSVWWGLRLASCAAMVALWLLAGWLTADRLQDQEHQAELHLQIQQSSLGAIITENLNQVVGKGYLLAAVASEALDGDVSATRRRLGAMLAADRVFIHYALYDARWQRLDASVLREELASPLERQALGQRLHEAARLRGVRQAMPVAVGAGSDGWQVPLLFLLPGHDSRSNGYLLLTLDLGYFLGLFRDVELGQGSAVQLLGADGRLMAEMLAEGLSLQSQPRFLPQWAQIQQGMAGVVPQAQLDGAPALASFRRSAETPFTVVVSHALRPFQAQHRAEQRQVWLGFAIFGLISLLATGAWFRVLTRQEGLFAQLSRANADKHGLIEQLEQEKSRALELAASDHLTGLHNRRMFSELVASHLEVARRSRRHYAVLYLDLDRFKQINDNLGHHVGDLLLQAVAQRLRQMLRSSDVIARMGGDEFAVLVSGLEQPGDMDALAAKLVARLSLPYEDLEGHSIQVTPSIGIAFFPRDGHDVERLCRHADAAMYEAKRAGRGRFAYYDAVLSPDNERTHRLQWQLPAAMGAGQLVLHYQPKVLLENFRIVGFEALVRWQHPDYGLVYPGDFIPYAERSGLITELGDWVIQACCKQVAAWRMQGLEPVPLAVNVSALQLRDPVFPARIAAHLQHYGVRATDLVLEITESSLVEPRAAALQVLQQLEAMGLRIGLDDFGTGFSSLSQIRDLPIDTIKLDRSFVNDIRTSKEAGVLVTSIITLAHNLHMRVVAEGVELMDQLVYLKTAGCDEVQGYFVSRPVPAAEAERQLRQVFLQPR